MWYRLPIKDYHMGTLWTFTPKHPYTQRNGLQACRVYLQVQSLAFIYKSILIFAFHFTIFILIRFWFCLVLQQMKNAYKFSLNTENMFGVLQLKIQALWNTWSSLWVPFHPTKPQRERLSLSLPSRQLQRTASHQGNSAKCYSIRNKETRVWMDFRTVKIHLSSAGGGEGWAVHIKIRS